MPHIPLTYIDLQLPMETGLVPNFRGAVLHTAIEQQAVFEAAGISTTLFHNHKEEAETGETYRRYPLVQYKVKHRKAEILGIGEGAKAVQLWLPIAGEQLRVKDKVYQLKGTLGNNTWQPTLGEEKAYRIHQWLPLNAINYEVWQKSPHLADRVALLDKTLWGHVFQVLDSLEVAIDRDQLRLYLSTIDYQTYETNFRIKKLALDVTFRSNLNFPEEIGLGQGVSVGFGKVQRIRMNY